MYPIYFLTKANANISTNLMPVVPCLALYGLLCKRRETER